MDAQQDRRTVVVGVDGSDSALRAVRWGAAEAGRRGIPLRLVIAFAWPHSHGHTRGDRYRDILLDAARGWLADAGVVAGQQVAGLDVEEQLVVGSPIAVLAEEARRAQVLVIGDRGLSRIEGLLAGSVAVALGAHAPCPVVVVRGAEQVGSGSDAVLPVLVGIDGTATSDAAVGFAFEAAAARRTGLVAVHCWTDTMFEPELAAIVYDRDAVEADEQQVLADRLAGWPEKYPDVEVRQLVTRDTAARCLIEQAGRAQLVVVGSRGHGELTGLVLSSVSNALLHRAPCPVAVVRSFD